MAVRNDVCPLLPTCDDWPRELFNSAVLERVPVRDGHIAGAQYKSPFDGRSSEHKFEYGDLVGATGLEPMTCCL
jgi:hypothetical protein